MPKRLDLAPIAPIAAQALAEAAVTELSAGRDHHRYDTAVQLLFSLPAEVQTDAIISLARTTAAALDRLGRRDDTPTAELLQQLLDAQGSRP